MSKKLEEKQRRRLAEERKKEQQRKAAQRRNLITMGVAGLVAILVVGLIIQQRNGSAAATNQDFGVSAGQAGCLSVQHPKPLPGIHIGLGQHHRAYDSIPPTSGPHYPQPIAPIDPGFYSTAQTPEKVLHNLEHGNIVIWYNPAAPEQVKSDIRAAVNEVPNYTLATPYDNMKPGYNVVITAWAQLQYCKQVSKQVIDDFRTKYQGRGASTEEGLSPTFTPTP